MIPQTNDHQRKCIECRIDVSAATAYNAVSSKFADVVAAAFIRVAFYKSLIGSNLTPTHMGTLLCVVISLKPNSLPHELLGISLSILKKSVELMEYSIDRPFAQTNGAIFLFGRNSKTWSRYSEIGAECRFEASVTPK